MQQVYYLSSLLQLISKPMFLSEKMLTEAVSWLEKKSSVFLHKWDHFTSYRFWLLTEESLGKYL